MMVLAVVTKGQQVGRPAPTRGLNNIHFLKMALAKLIVLYRLVCLAKAIFFLILYFIHWLKPVAID
jgi:hypothetical protein